MGYRWRLAIYVCFITSVTGIQAWTDLHSIVPSGGTRSKQNEQVWQWDKTDISAFSQAIFSWNALRPIRGYFTFSLQVRNSITKSWYPWHKMAQWGRGVQRSFESYEPRGTKFLYVRLELPAYRFADGFRVRVTAHQGAKITTIAQLAVNTINLRSFTSELKNKLIGLLPTVVVKSVPEKSQLMLNHPEAVRLCSPTSLSMLVSFLLKKEIDPRPIAKGVYDNGLKVYGSWPFNAAHAFELCRGAYFFHVERLRSFRMLHAYLQQSLPVMVSVRGPLKNAAVPSYKNGHLLVVVGYNRAKRKVICHDPAFQTNAQTKVSYDLSAFLAAWERSHRIAIVVKKNPQFRLVSHVQVQKKLVPVKSETRFFSRLKKLIY